MTYGLIDENLYINHKSTAANTISASLLGSWSTGAVVRRKSAYGSFLIVSVIGEYTRKSEGFCRCRANLKEFVPFYESPSLPIQARKHLSSQIGENQISN